uniref:Cytochrome c oxidase subunit 5B, mitochondrial n=1 Tax=Aceria tosichella TaxID=561515 RepID=A0A6G1S566_9ACAR
MASKILVRFAGPQLSLKGRYPMGLPTGATANLFVQSRHMASTTPNTPTTTKANTVATSSTTGTAKRESIKSKLASIFGGYVDPADPNEAPIPSDKVNFPDVTEHATGEEKLFLLAFENGILDPYCNLPTVRGDRGTRDNPVTIESFDDSRLIACVCEDTQNHHKYTNLYKGEPKRCQCGHWLELVDAPRFWEKIPKEDLVEIPWFRELEEEGKLDKFLQTGKLEDDHKHAH